MGKCGRQGQGTAQVRKGIKNTTRLCFLVSAASRPAARPSHHRAEQPQGGPLIPYHSIMQIKIVIIMLTQVGAMIALLQPAQPMPAISRLGSSPVCQTPQFATSKCVTPHRAASPPHVALASSLVTLLVGFVTRLSSRSPSTPVTRAAPHRQHRMEPCFLGASLCERVDDVEAGNTFYLCEAPVESPGYVSRKVGRGGRWVYYTTRPVIA
jgi:hypothetical protein